MITNETLGACPLCGAHDRQQLHKDLTDTTFCAVQGVWTLWGCLGCGVGYLDPRPDRESIAAAYRNYYTHADAKNGRVSWKGRVRERLMNGYLYWRHGARLTPRSLGCGALVSLVPMFRDILGLEDDCRHLPGRGGEGRALLDVGCGGGDFLVLAQTCGWDAQGIDPDQAAVTVGLHKGVNVRKGGLELFDGQAKCFDVITLSHVIEHVHDPIATLRDCRRLLKPGGLLWIATPNIDSFGHRRFGRNWRGLEAPRHLVLFNEPAMRRALEVAGFVGTRRMTSGLGIHGGIVRASYAMAQGLLPEDTVVLPWRIRLAALLTAYAAQYLSPARREFLIFASNRPHSD